MTTEQKHTKGPWKFRQANDGTGDFGLLNSSDAVLGECYADIRRVNEAAVDEAEANARRIVECVNGYDTLAAKVKELEAQIAEARRLRIEIEAHNNLLEMQADTLCEKSRNDDARVKELETQRDELLSVVKDAAEMVADWGCYASPYFQERHHPNRDVKELKDVIAKIEAEKAG